MKSKHFFVAFLLLTAVLLGTSACGNTNDNAGEPAVTEGESDLYSIPDIIRVGCHFSTMERLRNYEFTVTWEASGPVLDGWMYAESGDKITVSRQSVAPQDADALLALLEKKDATSALKTQAKQNAADKHLPFAADRDSYTLELVWPESTSLRAEWSYEWDNSLGDFCRGLLSGQTHP